MLKKHIPETSDVFKDFVFKAKAKATAFKAKAKDLQKKQGHGIQGQGLWTKAKAKKYSRPMLRTSKSRFHGNTLVEYCIYQIMQSNSVCPSSTIK